jgi:hypothetical protein
MTIDTSVTLVTVEGNYVDFEGTPIVGQIKFTLSDMLRNSLANQMIVPSTVTVTLDANGSFSTVLPSTNDPDVIPEFVYTVEESFPNGRTYTIVLPYTTVGSLNMADISPIPTSPGTYYSMVLRVPWDELVDDIDTLDSDINQVNDTVSESGEYAFMNASATTYTILNSTFASYTLLNAGPYQISALELAYWSDRSQDAADSAAASASTATGLTGGMLNSLLLIGG